jgi:hypothetical protein
MLSYYDPDPKCALFEKSKGACIGKVKGGNGNKYCPIHDLGGDRTAEFWESYHRKIKNRDFNFAYAQIPQRLDLEGQEWVGDTDFSFAVFKETVVFHEHVFRGAVRCFNTKFRGRFVATAAFIGPTDFIVSQFAETANFVDSRFEGPANFLGTKFAASVMFDGATFASSINFGATFQDSVSFSGSEERDTFSLQEKIQFDAVRFEKPELVTFYDVTLRPWWFIGGSSSKVKFIDVRWNNVLGEEIKRATDVYESQGYGFLAAAYRELAVNHEDAQRYREASDFRYSSMEALRRGKERGWAFWTLHWWYWAASGYGERIGRAAIGLLALWLIFGLAYTKVGFARTDVPLAPTTQSVVVTIPADTVGKPQRLSKALMYSLGTLSLQKPDPKPVTDAATFLATLESVFGPLQAALLILAIRRKFMR